MSNIMRLDLSVLFILLLGACVACHSRHVELDARSWRGEFNATLDAARNTTYTPKEQDAASLIVPWELDERPLTLWLNRYGPHLSDRVLAQASARIAQLVPPGQEDALIALSASKDKLEASLAEVALARLADRPKVAAFLLAHLPLNDRVAFMTPPVARALLMAEYRQVGPDEMARRQDFATLCMLGDRRALALLRERPLANPEEYEKQLISFLERRLKLPPEQQEQFAQCELLLLRGNYGGPLLHIPDNTDALAARRLTCSGVQLPVAFLKWRAESLIYGCRVAALLLTPDFAPATRGSPIRLAP